MKTRPIFSLLGSITILIAFAGHAYGDATEELHKTYSLKAGQTVQVQNINGNVEISAWNETYADVQATKRTREGKSELARVEIQVTTDNGLEIKTVVRKGSTGDGSLFSRITGGIGSSPKVNVDYMIKVPRTALIGEAQTVNGAVVLRGTGGEARAHTTNGTVTLTDGARAAEASTTNGDVVVKDGVITEQASTTNGSVTATLDGAASLPAKFTTVNGSISLTVPRGVNADVELRTVNGRVSVPEGLTLKGGVVSPRHISGKLGSGGKSISAETVNGSISVEMK